MTRQLPRQRLQPAMQRFYDKLRLSDNIFEGTHCIEWTGCVTKGGYGRFAATSTRPQKWVVAHRWFWEQMEGPIPPSLLLDHRCSNRCCVNLRHLQPATRKENAVRHVVPPPPQRGRTENPDRSRVTCIWGHDRTPANEVWAKGRHTPDCRACIRRSKRELYARKRAAATQLL